MTEEQKARRKELEKKYREIWSQDPDYIEKEELGIVSPPSDAARKLQLMKKSARKLILFLN